MSARAAQWSPSGWRVAAEPDRADVETRYRARTGLLHELAATLQQRTVEALDGTRHIDRVSFRVKSPHRFLEKCFPADAAPRYPNPLRQVEDQVAGRVLVFFTHDIDVVEQELRAYFGVVEAERKQPTTPSEFGYESKHLVGSIAEHHLPEGWHDQELMPVTFEMQIRTLFMHAWAEPQHDLGYKPESTLTAEDQRALAWIAASAWGADRTLEEAWGRLGDGGPCQS